MAHAGRMTNSSSPPPPRTSANWPRSFPHRSNREKPDRKGARAQLKRRNSAPANVCFSTESADSVNSPLCSEDLEKPPKRTFKTENSGRSSIESVIQGSGRSLRLRGRRWSPKKGDVHLTSISAARPLIFQFPVASFGFTADPCPWCATVWRDRRLNDNNGVDWRHGLGANRPFYSHPIVGMTNSGSLRTPEGQRVVMVLSRV